VIKINLLDSVTDRPTGVAMVEERVASPRTQTILLALVAFGLLVLGAGYDYVSTRSDHAAKQREFDNQTRINNQMIAVNREQTELERKTRDIQVRIDAIQKLRQSQQGPGSVLREIKARFDDVPGLYLKSVEQKGTELVIKGESPNESSVTRFGQSMEFSSGLFTDLNIETQREVPGQSGNGNPAPSALTSPDMPRLEVVTFTVKCNYNPVKDAAPAVASAAPPATRVAKN
jgi:Tfp pilus assembly protein PilN